MRILLIGEFSRLHNSLKSGLEKLGHEVMLVSTSDGFKSLPTDFNYQSTVFNRSYLKWLVKGFQKLTGINLIKLEHAYRFRKILPRLENFDIVQLINENSIKTHPVIEKRLLKKLLKQNNKMFLLSCGADHLSIRFANDKKFRYSILTPLHENEQNHVHYKFLLRYLKPSFRRLHEFLAQHVTGIIASDLDYHLPLLGHPKYKGMIPNPVQMEELPFNQAGQKEVIRIFHGVNRKNYVKKGNRFFDEALKIISEKYPDKTEIVRTENLPYSEYIRALENSDILLDQVYAYDQGYNALEAMARGMVVFTGAEQEWLDFYKLKEDEVAINALPDVPYLVGKLEKLILDRTKVQLISRKAREFIEKEHHYIKIAELYLKTWQQG
ncbi:MAG: glycosyltransferase [Flavobacteriaceae bacterium]|nr:glycosyltransferase [Flavobacteriaceae bacterium]